MPDYKRLSVPSLLALLCALALLAVLPASADDLRVCPEGCSQTSIFAALGEAQPGDTITVQTGTYRESPIIGNTVNLHGLDTGDGKPILNPEKGRIIMAANGAVLRGFVLSGPAPAEPVATAPWRSSSLPSSSSMISIAGAASAPRIRQTGIRVKG